MGKRNMIYKWWVFMGFPHRTVCSQEVDMDLVMVITPYEIRTNVEGPE